MGVDRDENGHYRISAKLVHSLIMTIFASILSIAGYMVIWASTDSARNATLDNRLGYIERELNRIDSRFQEYPPQWLVEDVQENSSNIRRLEER